MYFSALEFLEEERDAWRPYEALADLSDDELERTRPADGPTHGWAARDLLGHVLAWQGHALEVARELAVDPRSPSLERMDREWDERGGDVINEELTLAWRALPLEELRRRARELPGELRGTLTVVPETRWLKDATVLRWLREETVEHYEEHRPELEAILGGGSAAA